MSMQRLASAVVTGIGALGIAAQAAAGQLAAATPNAGTPSFSCVASAGVSKAETATLSGDLQRTGGYKIKVWADGSQVFVKADPEEPKRSGSVTRVAAPIDTLLLRWPFKSEA